MRLTLKVLKLNSMIRRSFMPGGPALLAALLMPAISLTGLLLARRLTLACLLLARLMLARLMLAALHLMVLAGTLRVARAVPLTLLTAAIPGVGARLAPVIADVALVFLVHGESSIL